MKKLGLVLLAAVLFAAFSGCPLPVDPGTDVVTGVTITGPGVTGTGASKQVTVVIGTPLDLDVTVTKSGSPDVTESWVSSSPATASVVSTTGVVSGLVENAVGVQVTVTVGGKSDSILVIVAAELEGVELEFDTDKLEFYSLAATTPTIPPTAVKNGDVITLTNTDGSFKQSDAATTNQGSSYLLFQTPFGEGVDFEVKAAVKMPWAKAASDKYSCGVGMFVVDPVSGKVTLDSKAALMAKRGKPDLRSLYSKSKTSTGGYIEAGEPKWEGILLNTYHILKLRRVGNTVTFDVNDANSSVDIDLNLPGESSLIYTTLKGEVRVGIMFAGVTVDVEAFVVSSLDAGGNPTELYRSGNLVSPVDYDVWKVDATGPVGSEQSASVDMAGAASTTIQLSSTYTPATATVGTTITYSVKPNLDNSLDTNVSVDAAGLVTITGTGDGSATIVASGGVNPAATDDYVITIVDSAQVVTSIEIPATLNIYEGQKLTLSPVTVLPAYVTDKSVTWSSDSASILVNADGEITVVPGTAIGTTGNITATSVLTPAVSSNACTVTVTDVDYTPLVYTFPTGNWGTNAANLLVSTATTDGTTVAFKDSLNATKHIDGLTYKKNSTGTALRIRYSLADGNAINYNGSSKAGSLPADGASMGGEADLLNYVSVPLDAIGTTNVKIDVVVRNTSTTASKIGLVGSDFILLTSLASTTADVKTISWTGDKSALTRMIIVFSREGASGGGLDVRSITLTPQ